MAQLRLPRADCQRAASATPSANDSSTFDHAEGLRTTCPRLRRAVAGKLRLDWSPEQIAGWLKRTHPEDGCNQLPHETIYRSLFVQTRGVLKKELLSHLRSKRSMRRSRPVDPESRCPLESTVSAGHWCSRSTRAATGFADRKNTRRFWSPTVAELLARAEAADHADVPDGMSIPDELARREKRLAKLAQARAKIEARAKERFEREAAEHKAKLAAREATSSDAAGRRAAC